MNEIVKVADKNNIMSKDYFLAMLLFFFLLLISHIHRDVNSIPLGACISVFTFISIYREEM